ncbi:MAG: hypothetical protein AVDCRST_MAG26-4671, partial [uncultured Chloroflexia bacterium]
AGRWRPLPRPALVPYDGGRGDAARPRPERAAVAGQTV